MNALRNPANDREDVAPFQHVGISARVVIDHAAEAKVEHEEREIDETARQAIEGTETSVHWHRDAVSSPNFRCGGQR